MQDNLETINDLKEQLKKVNLELEETIKSHQKQNAIVAKFEAVFCDYHLDNLPIKCPCCIDVEHRHEIGGES